MTFWKDKTVLVTGGQGFVGTHVVKMLKEMNLGLVKTIDDGFTGNKRIHITYEELK